MNNYKEWNGELVSVNFFKERNDLKFIIAHLVSDVFVGNIEDFVNEINNGKFELSDILEFHQFSNGKELVIRQLENKHYYAECDYSCRDNRLEETFTINNGIAGRAGVEELTMVHYYDYDEDGQAVVKHSMPLELK